MRYLARSGLYSHYASLAAFLQKPLLEAPTISTSSPQLWLVAVAASASTASEQSASAASERAAHDPSSKSGDANFETEDAEFLEKRFDAAMIHARSPSWNVNEIPRHWATVPPVAIIKERVKRTIGIHLDVAERTLTDVFPFVPVMFGPWVLSFCLSGMSCWRKRRLHERSFGSTGSTSRPCQETCAPRLAPGHGKLCWCSIYEPVPYLDLK